ncbi:MAG TPA: HK97 family phage prohead protease [Dehalococcoidia bacterium]|nr:HK97 family phage prohead protease [Dehalococcoidia bacterium]
MVTTAEKRAAIRPHSTETSDRAWDGPANEARLLDDQEPSYLERAYAWRDPQGDEGGRSDYAFLHHEVDSDGNIGPASIEACRAGITQLNAPRGLARGNWQGEREDIHRHLARHLEDADIKAVPLRQRAAGREMERRDYELIEIRAERAADGRPEKISGHAAVFNKLSEPIGWWGFRERVKPGAFKKTIKEQDIRALFNHNPDYVLGRNRSGTLTLREDKIGLYFEAEPPDTTWARDLMVSIERGDIDQASFSFRVINERWMVVDGEDVRELLEVKLGDVSPVTFPAYPQTDVQARSEARSDLLELGIDWQAIGSAMARSQRGLQLSDHERHLIKSTIELLSDYLPSQPDPTNERGTTGTPSRTLRQGTTGSGQSIAMMRRRLELVEAELV